MFGCHSKKRPDNLILGIAMMHIHFKTFLPGYLCKALSLANILLVLLHYMYVEYNSSVNII